MPYENDKNKDIRSGGKKSVTKKTAASSGDSRASSGKQASKPKTASASSKPKTSSAASKPKSTAARPTQSGTRKTAASAGKPRSNQRSAASSSKKAETAKSRQNTSARDDYKRFSQEIKKSENSKKTTSAKSMVQRAKTKGTGSARSRKGKSQSRSKLTSALTYIMIIFVFIALMVTLSLTVFFKIESINVTIKGEKYYNEDRVIAISEINEGENIFSVDLNKVEKTIEKTMPYIEKCEVKRKFPAGINIVITSAQPAGVITLETGERLIVSDEGKSLEILEPYFEAASSDSDMQQAVSDTDTNENVSDTDISQTDIQSDFKRNDHSAYIDETKLPEILGLIISDGTEPGSYIVMEDETAIATLGNLVELLGKYKLPPTKIDLSAGNLYSYYDNRLMIKLGSGADLEMKIIVASDIIHNKLSEYDSGRVDVTNSQKGYFTPEYLLKQPK